MLIQSIIFILLSNALTTRRDISPAFNRSLLNVLFASFFIGFLAINVIIFKDGISLLGGLFHNSSLSMIFHIFILFITLTIVQLTAFFPRKLTNNDKKKTFLKNLIENLEFSDKMKEQYGILEYPLILLFIIVGAILLISSSDIISIFLSIELQSYGLYLLCALYRNSELSTGASLTYFLLGGLSSCFILLASALIYTYSGTSALNSYYIVTNLSDVDYINSILYWYNNEYLNYSLLILSVGFLFKISAAPFHFWSPDVYDAIPTIVTTFVANIAKLSVLIFLVELVHFTGNLVISNFNWTNSLLVCSLLSLIIGSILGLNQSRIKRLLAYSTISHLGFMLLAISINSIESIQAFLFYLMQYSITNVNCFLIIISIGYTMYTYIKIEKDNNKLVDENNSPIQYITQLRGYYYINPLIAISLTIVIFSFVGIPPLVGFFGKQMILSSALDKGYIFISLIAILTSVISAVYYLNIVKEIFFDQTNYKLNNSKEVEESTLNENKKTVKNNNSEKINHKDFTAYISINLSATISILTLIILLFISNPDEWLRITNILAILIFN